MNFNFFYSFLNNNRGQGMSIEHIVKLLIILIVVLIILMIFSGQSSIIFDSVGDFLGIARDSTPKNLTAGFS
ncbi:hypothetical protein HON86_01380 [Candidatus Woesearchaeota archaeon]|jgi:hypothetical protein|nr:hypothetical protein [Candidatus Woesearchaeota archaeon]